jgi:hypothetical protein
VAAKGRSQSSSYRGHAESARTIKSIGDQPKNTESKSTVDRLSATSPSRGQTAILTHQFWVLEIPHFAGNRQKDFQCGLQIEGGYVKVPRSFRQCPSCSDWDWFPRIPALLPPYPMHQGLRSAQGLGLNEDDLLLSEAPLRVPGKGHKLRFLPRAPETVQRLDHYRRLEPPHPETAALFVSLKGPARGVHITLAGLCSFRPAQWR